MGKSMKACTEASVHGSIEHIVNLFYDLSHSELAY